MNLSSGSGLDFESEFESGVRLQVTREDRPGCRPCKLGSKLGSGRPDVW